MYAFTSRFRQLAVMVLVVAALLLWAAVAASGAGGSSQQLPGEAVYSGHDGGIHPEDDGEGEVGIALPEEGSPAPCAPLAAAVYDDGGQADGFAASGLGGVQVPSMAIENLRVASFTCLSDNIAGEVTAVFIELHDSQERFSGVWLMSRPELRFTSDWASYLRETFASEQLLIGEDDALLAVPDDTGGRHRLQAVRGKSPSVRAWDLVRHDLHRGSSERP